MSILLQSQAPQLASVLSRQVGLVVLYTEACIRTYAYECMSVRTVECVFRMHSGKGKDRKTAT